MTMRVLVVDDEPLARLGVCARLKQHKDIAIVGECASSDEAAQRIDIQKPDLLFLDVQMPGGSGVQLLRSFPPHQMPCTIFLTAHAEYAVDAFGVEALDYLLKPIEDGRFVAALNRARRLFQLRREQSMPHESSNPPSPHLWPSNHGYLQSFSVRRGKEISRVLASEVDWIEGLGDYAGLHVGKKVHLVRESLSSLSCRLNPQMFHRIHRSTIVQIDRIRHIKVLRNRDLSITLQDGTNLRTSRTYSATLQNQIQF
jgi:two-component system, LytTR family, response regulator